MAKLTMQELESRCNALDAKVQEQSDDIAMLKETVITLAGLVEALQNRPVEVSTRGGGKSTSSYVLHSVPTEGIQPQARKCMALAVEKFGLEVTIQEPELVAFFRSKQHEISSNQDAWSKVFCFYRGRLEEMGALTWTK